MFTWRDIQSLCKFRSIFVLRGPFKLHLLTLKLPYSHCFCVLQESLWDFLFPDNKWFLLLRFLRLYLFLQCQASTVYSASASIEFKTKPFALKQCLEWVRIIMAFLNIILSLREPLKKRKFSLSVFSDQKNRLCGETCHSTRSPQCFHQTPVSARCMHKCCL